MTKGYLLDQQIYVTSEPRESSRLKVVANPGHELYTEIALETDALPHWSTAGRSMLADN